MIITGNITCENPNEHWSRLNVKNKTVLDLGCGRTWNQKPTTPEYFLSQGAKAVIGVEMWINECDWLKNKIRDSRFLIICHEIKTADDIHSYLEVYKPEIVKCDIEGRESILNETDLSCVKEIAIEYHNEEMKAMIEKGFRQWGFNRLELWSMNGFDVEKQGVIYLFRQ